MAAEKPVLPQPASIDDKLKDFDSVPLFMRSLPDGDVDDTTLSALQSLAYDGTPDEVARNFKDQGNDYFKDKRYREALGFYTQGIGAKPTDSKLQEVLLCNRAACNLELQNYGSVLKDCSEALMINPRSTKAYYRSALALISLERPEEALDVCTRCLAIDQKNASVKALQDRAMKVLKKAKKAEADRLDRLRREAEVKRRLRRAFEERNLIVYNNSLGVTEYPYRPHFDEEDPTGNTLVLPTFFLYPQYATSDMISQLSEDTRFGDQLATMFPPNAPAPEWDRNGEYLADKLAIYVVTHNRRLLKIGKKMTLRELYAVAKGNNDKAKDGLEVKDGYLSFIVIPKGVPEQAWVEQFKTSKTQESA